MRTGFTPWTEAVLAQAMPYQRIVSFVIGNIEREHRLNLEALSGYWIRASTAWLIPLSLHGSDPSNREGVAEAATGE